MSNKGMVDGCEVHPENDSPVGIEVGGPTGVTVSPNASDVVVYNELLVEPLMSYR